MLLAPGTNSGLFPGAKLLLFCNFFFGPGEFDILYIFGRYLGAHHAVCNAQDKSALGIKCGATLDSIAVFEMNDGLAFGGGYEREPPTAGTSTGKEKLLRFVPARRATALLHELDVPQRGLGGFFHGLMNLHHGLVQVVFAFLGEQVHGFFGFFFLPFNHDLFFALSGLRLLPLENTLQHNTRPPP